MLAPFAVRPDTTEPGDLLGPFDGRVVDSATGKPVAGALVDASWAFELGRGLVAPAGAELAHQQTDSDGRYRIERLRSLPGAAARVVKFTLIVYKRGYLAYRSDRRFDDNGPRGDFAQRNNVARLDPAPADLSHVRHVRFVGGSATLRRALEGEVVQASLELSHGAPVREVRGGETRPLLDATLLLSSDELRAVTAFEGPLTTDRLADLPRTPTYDSRHFRAVGKPEAFDAALRVWKLDETGADARYQQLLREVPGATEKNELGDRSLRGRDGAILAVATIDRSSGTVIEMTCGEGQCHDHERVVALLRRVLPRAERLTVETAPGPGDEAPKADDSLKLREPELRR